MAEALSFQLPTLKKGDDLDKWIINLRIWQCETDIEKCKQGPFIYNELDLHAQECCKDIQVDDLISEDGPEYIVSALDTFYFEKVSVEGTENIQEEAIESIGDLCAKRPELPDTSRSSDNQDDDYVLKDKRLQDIISVFPDKDMEYLRIKTENFGFDVEGENKYQSWIEQELLNGTKEEMANNRYQTLLAFFPQHKDMFLQEKCNEFAFNEIGTEAFKTWVEENKKAECLICFDEENLECDMVSCPKGHLFCKECIQRGSNVAIGDGKSILKCMTIDCPESINIAKLEKVLEESVFSRWILKMQAAEVENAGIEGLEQCPFCSFVLIMNQAPEVDSNFICQHPNCGKKSCRLCKDVAHSPLLCNQVEKDEEVEKRAYIEGKMSEAMIRVCLQCKKPFVKQDGCNLIKCECGAKMCYLCRKPVKNYDHFVGEGGTPNPPHQICPLWSNNDILHTEEVARGGQNAKSTMEREKPNVELKIDPTVDLKKR